MPTARVRRFRWGLAVLCAAASACGQKGPPLAPLHLVPAPMTELTLRRTPDRAVLRFLLPSTNANGPGPVDLDHVDIFAATVAPGAPAPANRDLLSKAYLVGQIAVRPAPVEGEPPVEGDPRPGPGEFVTFEETLTPAILTPAPPKVAPKVQPPPQVSFRPPGTTVSLAGTPIQTDPVRLYVLRGVTKSGRAGPPSARVQFPIVPPPPSVTGVKAVFTPIAIAVVWTPPVTTERVSFNVYRSSDLRQPITPVPLVKPVYEQLVALDGQPHCFVVRTVVGTPPAFIEGAPSEEACVTPVDVFPPAAPAGLAAVPTPGQVSLIWDANAEADVVGYLVLRGEAGAAGELKAITPAPIRETSYRDATVTPGVRYVYAIVAVDSATPPNISPQSARVEETAR